MAVVFRVGKSERKFGLFGRCCFQLEIFDFLAPLQELSFTFDFWKFFSKGFLRRLCAKLVLYFGGLWVFLFGVFFEMRESGIFLNL